MRVAGFCRGLAALALVAVALPARAQSGAITGRVTDSVSGGPIANAAVMAVTTSGGVAGTTRTTDQGTFRLQVPAGTYSIQVLSIGHSPRTIASVVVAAQPVAVNVALGKANMLDQVVVTTTRGASAEKVLDAPSSVSVVDEAAIARRPALTTTDHLKSTPGVDISQGGIIQSNVVARGFNNIFSGSLLNLQDYRFAGVPSLRVNVPYLFTGTNDDIERIEVLLGPASALYGPNSANGVLHVITKSPFTSQGTTVTVDGGSQSLIRASLRHATVIGEKVGVKVSGEYMQGSDFKYFDPGEPTTFPDAAPPGRAGTPVRRDFDVERYTMEGRLDYRPDRRTEAVTTIGFTDAVRGIELTGANGAGQVRNWTYFNLQERFRRGRFFAQAFLNSSDAGNTDSLDLEGTYLIRSGQPIVDKSRVFAGQVQHGINISSTKITYGADYIFTNPRTGHTINGRNEDIDNVTEWGVYAQGTTPLTQKLDFISALRLDKHSEIDGYQLSPRAAFVYRPNDNNSFRVAYNRAFSTPGNFEYFLDLVQRRNVDGAGLDIRAVGNHGGRDFDRSCDGAAFGSFCMRSVYTSDKTDASAAAAYAGLINARAALLQAGIQAKLAANPQTAANAAALAAAIVNGLKAGTPTDAQLATHVACLLPGCAPLTADGVKDIGALKASFNNSLEAGYKGLIGKKGRVSIDLWYQQKGDVSPPAGVATPNVFTDSASLSNYFNGNITATLTPVFQSFGLSPQAAAANAAGLAAQVAPGLAGSLKAAPLGTITFADETRPDVLFTYFTLDKKVNVYGIDLGYDWQLTNAFALSGTYSWQNKNVFSDIIFAENTGANGLPYMSNSPKNKASLTLRWESDKRHLSVEARGRYTDAFPVNSGVYYSGKPIDDPNNADPSVTLPALPPVRVIAVMDAGINWRVPLPGQDLTWALNGTNLFDNKRPTFVGTPAIGRMLITRLQYKF
ncbi:MAG TPA: TonB-dependent receptor [Gemmatimonadaceae bacterium]|nr:TonB-dependent receptor [Gemmatimonadaceae bacterium]